MNCIPFYSLKPNDIIALASEKLKGELADWEKDIWLFVRNWFDDSLKTITVFTSGSTGTPRRIEHTKLCILRSAQLTCEALELKPGSCALLCLPADKISGMMMLVRSISKKMDLYFIRPSANPLDEVPNDFRFDFAAFTPMQLFEMTLDKEKLKRAQNIRKIILGGEKVPSELLKSIRNLDNEVYATFGMTETISHIALQRLSSNASSPFFKTLKGVDISTDKDSRLIIHAPELGVHQLRTNDVVRIYSATEFEWKGRVDNVINTGGVKVYPEEIEERLQPSIQFPFFVGSVNDERVGEKVVLVIEADSISKLNTQDLTKMLLPLPSVHRPRAIFLSKQFKRTGNGKVKRKESLQGAVLIAEA